MSGVDGCQVVLVTAFLLIYYLLVVVGVKIYDHYNDVQEIYQQVLEETASNAGGENSNQATGFDKTIASGSQKVTSKNLKWKIDRYYSPSYYGSCKFTGNRKGRRGSKKKRSFN